MVVIDQFFDTLPYDVHSAVFQIFPNVYSDNRGCFCQKLSMLDMANDEDEMTAWIHRLDWIKQINESHSTEMTIRGCHAQKDGHCQGKLVESIEGVIYDMITDMRPRSKTFGKTNLYVLNPDAKNMLWVPRGFLHAFITGSKPGTYIFQYFVDREFCKSSETGANPLSIIENCLANDEIIVGKDILQNVINSNMNMSSKDLGAISFEQFKELAEENERWFE